MFISIIGVFNYFNNVFNDFVLPAGADKQTAIDTILFECGELPLVYSKPELLQSLISTWSKSMAYRWEHLFKTTTLEYEPIENYDRKEEWTDTTEHTEDVTSKDTSETNGYSDSSGERVDKVAGFEAGALVDKSQSNDSGNTTTTTRGTVDSTNNTTGTTTYTRTGRAHGNIGVTTSQQMLQSERDVSNFSFYETVAADFKERFCIMIY